VSPDTEQAIRMLDSFGARYFELTVNDLKGEKMATATAPHPAFAPTLPLSSPRRLNASKTLSSGLAVRSCSSTTSLTLARAPTYRPSDRQAVRFGHRAKTLRSRLWEVGRLQIRLRMEATFDI